MDKSLIKIAEQYEKTAKNLLEKAKMLRAGINHNSCKYMTDTGKPKVANYPCKGNAIECTNEEVGKMASFAMTTKKCNPTNCKHFSAK